MMNTNTLFNVIEEKEEELIISRNSPIKQPSKPSNTLPNKIKITSKMDSSRQLPSPLYKPKNYNPLSNYTTAAKKGSFSTSVSTHNNTTVDAKKLRTSTENFKKKFSINSSNTLPSTSRTGINVLNRK
jgi:hypothetical protein